MPPEHKAAGSNPAGRTEEKQMDSNITSLLLFIMIIVWQVIMWKKIELQKWQDYSMSAIMVGLSGWLVYLTFLS
tara:strand:+ start:294 stop:515 length:222 start_codon:yes stop_codon:yes gene_type:complete